jgi:hypothetical protein
MLAQPLSSQNQGYSDTVYLNGVLEYADGTAITIGSDEYIPVVLAPNTATAEEAWLTTTPAGSPYPSATLIRGTGSSTGAPAHTLPCVVAHGPTPYDKLLSIDDPWAGNLGLDYEFQGDTTSLPSYSFNGTTYTWTWLAQTPTGYTGASYSEAWGRGSLAIPSRSGGGTSGIQLALSNFASTWTATVKLGVQIPAANYNYYYLGLYDSTSGKLITLGVQNNVNNVVWQTWASLTTTTGSSSISSGFSMPQGYYRIQCTGTTTYTFSFSGDGINYTVIQSAYNSVSSLSMTPSSIFIGGSQTCSIASAVSCQFFRVR